VGTSDVQLAAGAWHGDQHDVDGSGSTNIVDIMLISQHLGDQAYLTGWYSGFTRWYPYESMIGSLLTMPYISESHYADKDIPATLDRLRTGRVQALVELQRAWVRDGNVAAIEDFVRMMDPSPSVYGWYLYDEPLGPVSLENFLAAADAIRKNSDKPIAVAFCCGQSPTVQLIEPSASWYAGFDILMYDWYPIYNGSVEFAGWPEAWSNSLDHYASLAETHGKAFIPVLQGHGCKDDGSTAWGRRDPTSAELRYLFWTSAVRKTVGSLWFAHYRALITPGLQAHSDGTLWCVSGLNDGIRPKIELLHTLAETVSPKITGSIPMSPDVAVEGITYKYGRGLLIAVNEIAVNRQVNFTLSDIVSGTATVLGEGRTVPILAHNLSDAFDAFDTHVYEIRRSK